MLLLLLGMGLLDRHRAGFNLPHFIRHELKRSHVATCYGIYKSYNFKEGSILAEENSPQKVFSTLIRLIILTVLTLPWFIKRDTTPFIKSKTISLKPSR